METYINENETKRIEHLIRAHQSRTVPFDEQDTTTTPLPVHPENMRPILASRQLFVPPKLRVSSVSQERPRDTGEIIDGGCNESRASQGILLENIIDEIIHSPGGVSIVEAFEEDAD